MAASTPSPIVTTPRAGMRSQVASPLASSSPLVGIADYNMLATPCEHTGRLVHLKCNKALRRIHSSEIDGDQEDAAAFKDFLDKGNEAFLPVILPNVQGKKKPRSVFKNTTTPPTLSSVAVVNTSPPCRITSTCPLPEDKGLLLTFAQHPAGGILHSDASSSSLVVDRFEVPGWDGAASGTSFELKGSLFCALVSCDKSEVAIVSLQPGQVPKQVVKMKLEAGAELRVVRVLGKDKVQDRERVKLIVAQGGSFFAPSFSSRNEVRERGSIYVLAFWQPTGGEGTSKWEIEKISEHKHENLCGLEHVEVYQGRAFGACSHTGAFIPFSAPQQEDFSLAPSDSRLTRTPSVGFNPDCLKAPAAIPLVLPGSVADMMLMGDRAFVLSADACMITMLDVSQLSAPKEVFRLVSEEDLADAVHMYCDDVSTSASSSLTRVFVLSRSGSLLVEVHADDESMVVTSRVDVGCTGGAVPRWLVGGRHIPGSSPTSIGILSANAAEVQFARPQSMGLTGLGSVFQHYTQMMEASSPASVIGQLLADGIAKTKQIQADTAKQTGIKSLAASYLSSLARASMTGTIRVARSLSSLMGVKLPPTFKLALHTAQHRSGISFTSTESVKCMSLHWSLPLLAVALADDSVQATNVEAVRATAGRRSAEVVEGYIEAVSGGLSRQKQEWRSLPSLPKQQQTEVTGALWRPLAAKTLAVLCREGVILWRGDGRKNTFEECTPHRRLTVRGHTDVTCGDWSSDGRFLVTGSNFSSLNLVVWDVDASSHSVLQHVRGGVGSVAFSREGDMIATCSATLDRIAVWHKMSSWSPTPFTKLGHPVSSLCWSEGGQVLWVASKEGNWVASVVIERRRDGINMYIHKKIDLSELLERLYMPAEPQSRIGTMVLHAGTNRMAISLEGGSLSRHVLVFMVDAMPSPQLVPLGVISGPENSAHCEGLVFWDRPGVHVKAGVLAARWYSGEVTMHVLGSHASRF